MRTRILFHRKRTAEQQEAGLCNDLLELAYEAATFEQMAILGEGNVSGKISAEQFLIKASGTQLETLSPNQLVKVNSQMIIDSLMGEDLPDDEVEVLLLNCRADPEALKPSVETLFHAWLLNLPSVSFVGHTHPIAVNQLLCSPRASDFAKCRLFPDQIVYCGKESVVIPYVDPGTILAKQIADDVESFIRRTGDVPKTILLENHGIIALGSSGKQVAATLQMAEKSARVFVGAMTAGGPVFMPDEQVERIAARSDEHYRQRMLEITQTK